MADSKQVLSTQRTAIVKQHGDTSTQFGPPFDDADADIILQSCDRVDFRIYKNILTKASPFFRDMFSIPQPKDDTAALTDASLRIPVIPVSEDARTLARLLQLCYPADEPNFSTLEEMGTVLAAAKKYDMARAYKVTSRAFAQSPLLVKHPVQAFGIAYEDLQYVEGRALYQLWRYHRTCARAAQGLTEEFIWIGRRDGQVWNWASPIHPGGSCGAKVIRVASNEDWSARGWWSSYMERAGSALQMTPSALAVTSSSLLMPSIETANNCTYCRTFALETLMAFSQVLAQEVERRTSQIQLDIPF
ncbi:hypothetical protein EW146_g9803 [Bondarzewia mesenterica]|uniref:BTB domain-containing protein n=1 Tax=Bondarzewia mesenterica TaxID=1095465 RepID=A0A4S4L3A9_9AGAM|nr:hypothetical protein EW146_g9803 [Bondarzewia mesenterica]